MFTWIHSNLDTLAILDSRIMKSKAGRPTLAPSGSRWVLRTAIQPSRMRVSWESTFKPISHQPLARLSSLHTIRRRKVAAQENQGPVMYSTKRQIIPGLSDLLLQCMTDSKVMSWPRISSHGEVRKQMAVVGRRRTVTRRPASARRSGRTWRGAPTHAPPQKSGARKQRCSGRPSES